MRYHLVVVGMGSAGLVAAEFAAGLGLRVAAVEADRLGGDCLWTGCVPSKTLIAAAKEAAAGSQVGVDLPAVWRHIRAVREQIAATDDSPERYRGIGVELVEGQARLAGPHAVEVPGRTLDTRYVLLCTGSRPAAPEIPGLIDAGFLTSETLWELEQPPRSLVVLGGGPIGCELAQACARLGIDVALLQRGDRLLPRDEPELSQLAAESLRQDGVDVRLRFDVEQVWAEGERKLVKSQDAELAAAEVVVAVGRRPNIDGLRLDELGVRVGERGIEVDSRLRTSVRSIYAVGDVAGRFLFTHSAAAEAVQAVRDMFFPGRGRAPELVPWCTFTDPELAHVGLTSAEAERRFGRHARTWRIDLAHSDRARADGVTRGRLLFVTARGKLVGAHVLAPHAGELIHELALAIDLGLKLERLSRLVHVYPTYSTEVARLAGDAALERARRYSWMTRIPRLPWRI